jgi:hypothetical protein
LKSSFVVLVHHRAQRKGEQHIQKHDSYSPHGSSEYFVLLSLYLFFDHCITSLEVIFLISVLSLSAIRYLCSIILLLLPPGEGATPFGFIPLFPVGCLNFVPVSSIVYPTAPQLNSKQVQIQWSPENRRPIYIYNACSLYR